MSQLCTVSRNENENIQMKLDMNNMYYSTSENFYGGKQTLNRQYWSRKNSNLMRFGASQLNADFAVSFPTIFKYEIKTINNLSQTSNIICGALK
jgi:hypothetical protein